MPTEPIPPTKEEFDRLRDALVSQLPDLEPAWWRRVKKAVKDESADRLALLKAEAENRLDHESDRRAHAIIEVLFRLLGLMLPD